VNRRLGVLISGRGSNLQSIIDAIARGTLDAAVAVVIANCLGAGGLVRARDAGIDTMTLLPQDYTTREIYDQALVQALQTHDVGLVCLAGFMRLIGAPLLEAFPDRILNIHPSLLPSFRGLHAQAQALAHGVKVSGATVHFVTAGLDDGPIVLQAAVPVADGDTAETLAARTLIEEHRLYPAAIAMVLEGAWRIEGRRFLRSGSGHPQSGHGV
jgi:phosphoribosylglycinamide formyltransferase 1